MEEKKEAPWLWVDCSLHPGCGSSQPQALRMARPAEILAQPCVVEALRKAQDLLSRYIHHVRRCEGISYIPADDDAELRGFTVAEVGQLRYLLAYGVTPRTAEPPVPGEAAGPPEPTEG